MCISTVSAAACTMPQRPLCVDLPVLHNYTLELVSARHLNVHKEFDPGMVEKGVLACSMTSLRKWSVSPN